MNIESCAKTHNSELASNEIIYMFDKIHFFSTKQVDMP